MTEYRWFDSVSLYCLSLSLSHSKRFHCNCLFLLLLIFLFGGTWNCKITKVNKFCYGKSTKTIFQRESRNVPLASAWNALWNLLSYYACINMKMQCIFTLQIDKKQENKWKKILSNEEEQIERDRDKTTRTVVHNKNILLFKSRLYSWQVFRIYLSILLYLHSSRCFWCNVLQSIRHNFACMRYFAFLEHVCWKKNTQNKHNFMQCYSSKTFAVFVYLVMRMDS